MTLEYCESDMYFSGCQVIRHVPMQNSERTLSGNAPRTIENFFHTEVVVGCPVSVKEWPMSFLSLWYELLNIPPHTLLLYIKLFYDQYIKGRGVD